MAEADFPFTCTELCKNYRNKEECFANLTKLVNMFMFALFSLFVYYL